MLILLIFEKAFSQENIPVERIYPARINEKIKLDGRLDEGCWQSAKLYSGFMQAFPRPGSSPSESTFFRVLYDNDYLYVGIIANDKEPEKIIASGFARDSYSDFEDGIQVLLDTYYDKYHANAFYANVLNARQDGEKIGNEYNFNISFNTFWDVKTNKGQHGYTMEFRIPFSSLRFRAGEKVVMGFKLLRQIGRKNERVVFPVSDSTISNISWRISNEAEIEFTGLNAKKPVYFNPYIKADYSEQQIYNRSSNQYEKQTNFMQQSHFVKNRLIDKAISNVGIDMKMGISKNFTLDATLNTDFAQAEADNRIINLTRFGVNMPEKRIFFLESNDFLNFSIIPDEILLFNSRNIGIENGKIIPIVGGVRLTGKTNGYQAGLLNMQTIGLDKDSINPQNFSVVRLRKDLFKNGSYAGVFFANRQTTDSKKMSNQTVAADYYHRVNDFWSYGFNIAGTAEKGLPLIKSKNNAFNLFIQKDPLAGWGHFITGNVINKNFNPESGFASDKGFKDVFILEGYTWQFGKANKLNSILANISSTYRWRDAAKNYLEFERYAGSVKLYYKNGSQLTWYGAYSIDRIATAWQLRQDIKILPGKYKMVINDLYWQSATNKRFYLELNPLIGGFYGGNRSSLTANITYNLNKHFNAGVKYSYSEIEFADAPTTASKTFISHLVSANFQYSYDTRFSARMLWQYDNLSKTISTNIRVRYNPKEGTDLYFVYNPVLNTNILSRFPETPRLNNQQVIVKYSTTLNL